MNFRIVPTGLGDGALGIIDDHPPDDPAKGLESVAMAGQPGGDILIAHHFRVLMARPTQRHHEHPGLEGLAGAHIGDQRPGAEIDLGGLAGLEPQPQRHLRRCDRWQLLEEPMDGGITPGIAVAAHQRRMNGRSLDAFFLPSNDLRPPRFQAGNTLARQTDPAGKQGR